MAGAAYEFELPDRFVAGTVGPPGERTFYLQARDGRRLTSVALEKQQVMLLAERMEALLDEILRLRGDDVIPAIAPMALDDTDPLDTPVDEDFRAVGLSLAWDDASEHIVVEARSQSTDDEDPFADDDAGDVLRVTLTPAAARAFAKRAAALVSAGRPACPFCSLPLDPDGHVCPRANGYRR